MEWSFGYLSEKWTHSRLSTFSKSKGATVIVWAAIGTSIGRRSDLIIMERDEYLQGQGYTSGSYIQALKEGLLPMYDSERFMQDNAPIHTSTFTNDWFNNRTIYRLPNWPPYSPNLNLIEHL